MAVRSAFALLCFALLCGLAAASSGFQSETETELRTKNEGEAAGNQVLVAEAVESRVARGSKKGGKKNACKEDPKSKECKKRKKNRKNKPRKGQKNDKPKKTKGKKTKKNRNKQRRNNNRQNKKPGKAGKKRQGRQKW